MEPGVLLEVAKQAPALIVALAALGVLGGKLDRLVDRVDRLSEVMLGHDPDAANDRQHDNGRRARRTIKESSTTPERNKNEAAR